MRTKLFFTILHLIFAYLFCGSAWGKTASGSNYLAHMPSIEQVLNDVQGKDELDTKARQSVIFEVLYDVITSLADERPKAPNQGSNTWFTDEEKKLNGRYSGTATKMIVDDYDELDPSKKDRFQDNSSCGEWRKQRMVYMQDNVFVGDALKKYLPKDVCEHYLKLREKRMEEYLASNPQQQAPTENMNNNQEQGPVSESHPQTGKSAIILIIGLVLLLVIPGVIYYRNKTLDFTANKVRTSGKEYDVHSVTGVVADATKFSTVSVHTSGGTYNQSTGTYSPTTVHSTTTIHDQIFVVDGNGNEHAIKLAGWDIATRAGHKLTMIWAIRKGKGSGPYLMALNHSTNLKYHMNNRIRTIFFPHWKRWYGIIFIFLLLGPYIFSKNLGLPELVSHFFSGGSHSLSTADFQFYLSIYGWTWIFTIAGFLFAGIAAGAAASKKTTNFIDAIRMSDYA